MFSSGSFLELSPGLLKIFEAHDVNGDGTLSKDRSSGRPVKMLLAPFPDPPRKKTEGKHPHIEDGLELGGTSAMIIFTCIIVYQFQETFEFVCLSFSFFLFCDTCDMTTSRETF